MNHEKRAEYQSISAIKSKAASWAANAMSHHLEGQVTNSKAEQPSIEQAAAEECQLSPEQVREKILDYVERISHYAACAKVRDIWQTILQDEELFPLFRFTRYAKSRGRINWYRVTVVMCQLYEQGVYRQELSAEKLHCCLEGTTRRNARYTGMNRYLLEREQSKRIRQILRQFRP